MGNAGSMQRRRGHRISDECTGRNGVVMDSIHSNGEPKRNAGLFRVPKIGFLRRKPWKTFTLNKMIKSNRPVSDYQATETGESSSSGNTKNQLSTPGTLPGHDQLEKRVRPINVNTCSVFDLASLDGVDHSIAGNIVVYREKKGPFRQLDVLLKVPGVTKSVYSRIVPLVTVSAMDDDDSSGLHVPRGERNGRGNRDEKVDHSGQNSSSDSTTPSVRIAEMDFLLRLLSGPAENENDPKQADIDLVYQLMCSKSTRPKLKQNWEGTLDYDDTRLRLGFWDLEGCSFDKVDNPGVLEVICMTIVENRWNVVTVVDFTSNHVLDRIVAELNFPRLRKVKMYRENCQRMPRFKAAFAWDGTGRYRGYIFAIPFASMESSVTHSTDAVFQVGTTRLAFRYGEDTWQNIESDSLDEIRIQQRGQRVSSHDDCLSFGRYLVRWNDKLSSRFTGAAGIVEDGLTHLSIPNGWSLGGRVTESNPIWVNFSLNDGTV